VATADFGYLRLRAADYSEAEIESWAARISAQSWTQVFAFFKHEDKGPAYARRLNEMMAEKPGLKRPRAAKSPGVVKPKAAPKKRRKSG
jgi:uncharacterized protein YecE (DUF72 family)